MGGIDAQVSREDTRESGTGSEGEGLEIVKGRPQKDKMELAPGSTAVYYLSPIVRGPAVEAATVKSGRKGLELGGAPVLPQRLAPG